MKILLTVLLFLSFYSSNNFALNSERAPEELHKLTTIEIIEKLQNQHYQKLIIDDHLANALLTNYLKAIDPGKQVFTKNEVDNFYKIYGTTLDDDLKKGNVSAGFNIFNVYQSKSIKELQSLLNNLPATIKSFTFGSDETLTIDRSKLDWPKTQQDIDAIWLQRLKASVLSLKLTGKSTEKIIELLGKRYKTQLDRIHQMNNEDVYQVYMNTFTELYDPHTNYLSPANSKNFDINMSLKLEGIGAMLGAEDEYTKIIRLIPAGPADKEGSLKASDKVIGVGQGRNGEIVDILGWRLDDVVNLIRGKKGTVVRLEIIPANAISDDETKIIAITRDEVKLEEQSVQKAMLDIKDSQGMSHKIGVLDIPAFYIDFEALRNRDPNYKSTTRDTAILLSELIQQGAEGIIIDLRENGGGSLREANELTGLFIDKGPSVQIRQANNRVHVEAKQFYSPYYDGPVIVLVNRMSASASEIFAAAMQDYQRALIVGSRTFGKGTVQSLTPLNHGTLKVTESKFYRISGDSTQHHGVSPDLSLPSLYNESLIGESSLDNAMKWDAIKAVPHKKYYNFTPFIAKLTEFSKQRAANDPDFILVNQQLEYEKSVDTNVISLNEKKRIKERNDDKAYRLKLINAKNKAKGEDLIKSLDPIKDDNGDGIDDDAASKVEFGKIDESDPYLREAANILLDSQSLMLRP